MVQLGRLQADVGVGKSRAFYEKAGTPAKGAAAQGAGITGGGRGKSGLLRQGRKMEMAALHAPPFCLNEGRFRHF